VNAKVFEDGVGQLSLSSTVESLAQTRIVNCYQCGKCTAGCPVAARMDVAPNQLIRMLQLGQTSGALRSRTIWECVSCQTCTARCPKEVDCAAVMDALRELSLAKGMVAPSGELIVAFQQAFLENIRRNGRLAELGLIAKFKTTVFFRTGRLAFLFKDADLAPQMSMRKKLHLLPGKGRDRDVVKRIFAKCSNGKSL
jgi:heterodisulfide reductase subunit C2